MAKILKFYRPIININDTNINVDIYQIFKRIFDNGQNQSFRKIKTHPSILKEYCGEVQHAGIIKGLFLKYRSSHIPYFGNLKKEEIKSLEEIEELKGQTLVEVTNFLFDSSNSCLVLEYNREGHKEQEFEEYINTFLCDGYTFQLKKHIDDYQFRELLNTERARGLTLKLNLDNNLNINNNTNAIFKNNFIAKKGILDSFSSLFKSTSDVSGKLESPKFEINFSLGNQQGTFNLEYFRNIVEPLNTDNPILEKIIVNVEKGGRLEEVNLKTLAKHLTSKILTGTADKNPSFQRISDEIFRVYRRNHRNLRDPEINFLKEYNFEIENLHFYPREIHRVDDN